MYPVRRLNQIRELEFFLFRGVPEEAETVFERDSNAYVDQRTTRRSLMVGPSSETSLTRNGICVGEVKIDTETGELSITEGPSDPTGP